MKTAKKKLLVLAKNQFGYSTTSFKQCEFAREIYDITYIGWDYGLPKVELTNIDIKYVSRKSNKVARNIKLLKTFHKEVNKGYDFVFTNYVIGISLLRILNPSANFIIYIVTLGVMPSKLKRFVSDYVMKMELFFFKKVLLISKGIGKKLLINKFKVLPLGGECFAENEKSFENLSLLYVGTLENRNLIDCVKGFHMFVESERQNGRPVNANFTIIGSSDFDELEEINDYIEKNELEKYIRTTGYVDRQDLKPFYSQANVGVSYVPIKPYYQYQPPTKTYEYLISGLPVIATATYANKEIVQKGVGVIIQDNPNSFCKAIYEIREKKESYNSDIIRKKYMECTWRNVVEKKFIPLLEAQN